MGEPRKPKPVMLLVAAFSGWTGAIRRAREILQIRYGPIVLESPVFDFVETDYYDDAMGPGLKKQFFAFEHLLQAEDLPAIKLATNTIEQDFARDGDWATARTGVPRPINLDPGYLDAGKLVLATTKDQAHRLYLGQGIFAEVTLRFESGEFVPWPWTYPDYRREDYRAFFKVVRGEYVRLLKIGHRS